MTGSDQPSVLVVAIGNSDRGDDGFGPSVASKLRGEALSGVRILERSGDVLALIEDWSSSPSVIIVDAMTSITKPGRVHRLDLTHSPLPIGFSPRSSPDFSYRVAGVNGSHWWLASGGERCGVSTGASGSRHITDGGRLRAGNGLCQTAFPVFSARRRSVANGRWRTRFDRGRPRPWRS